MFSMACFSARSVLMALLFVMLHGCAESQTTPPVAPLVRAGESLPLPSSAYKPLAECRDEQLEESLERVIQSHPQWQALVDQKKMSVGIVDLNDVNQVRFASVNGQEMVYAASLPKIAVLLAAMDALEKRELQDSPAIRRDMRLMISKSDNEATTRLIDLLGFEKIAAVMQDSAYQFYDESQGGGLWVGKRYAPTGARVPEPMKGISHAATVDQVCRFYYEMAFGALVSRQRSAQMLSIMEKPELHHKFVNTLDRIAPEARVFRKSGTWQQFHADSVLVWGPDGRRYILVALIEDSNGEQIMRDLVVPVERALGLSGGMTAQAAGS